MGKVLESLTESEEAFIAKQKVFFVATAPLDRNHHVNVSAKAPGSSVVVLDPHTIAYADLSGSGAETAAHLYENERMTVMFCNLESGPPKILRLHGRGKVFVKEDIEPSLLAKFPKSLTSNFGFRAIYVLKAERISSSCGYSLPVMTFEKHRETLNEFTERKGADGMLDYSIYKNSFSIDGLPSLAFERFRDVNIIPKPEDGYIFGERASSYSEGKVAKVGTQKTHGNSVVAEKNTPFSGALLFLAGCIVGSGACMLLQGSNRGGSARAVLSP